MLYNKNRPNEIIKKRPMNQSHGVRIFLDCCSLGRRGNTTVVVVVPLEQTYSQAGPVPLTFRRNLPHKTRGGEEYAEGTVEQRGWSSAWNSHGRVHHRMCEVSYHDGAPRTRKVPAVECPGNARQRGKRPEKKQTTYICLSTTRGSLSPTLHIVDVSYMKQEKHKLPVFSCAE